MDCALDIFIYLHCIFNVYTGISVKKIACFTVFYIIIYIILYIILFIHDEHKIDCFLSITAPSLVSVSSRLRYYLTADQLYKAFV